MEAITEKVIGIALNHLKAAGCRYLVIDKDERTHLHGIEESQVRLKRVRGPNHGPRNDWSSYGHVEKIKAMPIGEVLQFRPKDGDDPEGLRKVISSSGNRFFGSGGFATTITDGVIEIIRLA